MNIAFLQCDHVRTDLQSFIGGDYDVVFTNMLQEHNPSFKVDCFDLTELAFPKDIDSYDVYISSGSQNSVYDDIPWIYKFKEFVQLLYHKKKKFIGICFGHQMIAEALGGIVEKSEKGWCIGAHNFKFEMHPIWLQTQIYGFNAIMSCQDQIRELPMDSKIVASSEQCPVGMFQLDQHFLGIQGHPEWTKEYSKATIKDRIDKIGLESANNGLLSLNKLIDRSGLIKILSQFITH